MNTNNAPEIVLEPMWNIDVGPCFAVKGKDWLPADKMRDISAFLNHALQAEFAAALQPQVSESQPAAVSADAVDGGWYRIDEVTPPHEETVLLYTPATEFSPYEIEAGWASGGELITFPDGRQSISSRWRHGSATHWKPIGPLPAALSPETVCGGDE